MARGERTMAGRFFRALVGTLVGAGLVAILAAGAALWVLHHLDHPLVREWLTRSVREATGIEVDYQGVDFALTRGLTLRGVRVLTPEPFRSHAPVLAGVEQFEVAWDLGSFVSGPLRVSRVMVSGVRVTLVQDEVGRSSLQALLEALPKPEKEKPRTPLSRGLPIQGLGVVVESLEVRDVALTRLLLRGNEVARSEVLEGMVLQGDLHAGNAPETASLALKSPDVGPTRVSIRETGPDGAASEQVVMVRHAARIVVSDPLHARVSLDVAEIEQNIRPDLSPSGPVLSLGFAITFHPEESRISIQTDRITIGNALASSTFQADYFDDPGSEVLARLGKMEVSADLDRVPEAIRSLFPDVDWTGGSFRLAVEGVEALRTAPWARISGKASALLSFPEITAVAGERRVKARELEARVDVAPGSLKADASLRFRLARVREPARLTTLRDGAMALGVTIEDVSKAVEGLLSGTATWKAGARMASVRTPAGRIRLHGLNLTAFAPFRMDPPYQMDGDLRLDGLTWFPARGEKTSLEGVRIGWTLRDAVLDGEAPARSTGRLSLRGGLADISLEAEVVKGTDQADLNASLAAPTLQVIEPFVDAARGLRIPFGRMGLSAKAAGRVTGLDAQGGPHLDQHVTASLTGFQAIVAGHRVEVPSLAADLSVTGRLRDLQARINLEASGARLDSRVSLRRVALLGEARWHASTPEARVSLEVSGHRGPTLQASLQARVDGPDRAVTWSGSLAARALSDFALLLPPAHRMAVDLSTLEAHIETSGRVTGLLERGLHPASRPLDSARGGVSLSAKVRGLAYRSERLEVEAPDLEATFQAEREGPKGTVKATLAYPSLRVDQRVRRFEISQGSHALTIETDGDPRMGEVALAMDGTVGGLSHDASATYPIGQASLRARARVTRMDAVRLDEFVLVNPAGGTRIEATAALDDLGGRLPTTARAAWDLVVGRRSLAVTGTVEQRLDPLSRESFPASGLLKIPFHIQSGDRSLFRVSATIEVRGVSAEVPSGRIAVRGMNGTIPIQEEVALGREGRPSLVLETDHNLFSRVRFSDQHPFLRGGGFVAADRLIVGPLEVGPVAGNLRILRNLVSLDQIEASWREGKVSGQVIVEYHPGDPRVAFRGKVTGIRTSESDERLDANAAVDVSLGRREVAGRVHFVRMGRGHLLDLMDALDPYRENVSANRIRKALKYGYPKYARVRVNGGFLSAKVELGGLGSIVRIDEVRGIPTGPLLSRALGPPKE